MSRRRLAVITGTRAEYGLLYGILRELEARADAELLLVATGAHLSAAHGTTVEQIEADGFRIAAKVDLKLSGDAPLDVAQATARATGGLAQAFSELKPDLAVILGDRYEMLAAATAAALLGIPIAHIHGGEVTEGAIDESIRHAITKLAYWHFASAEPYRARIIQLGEDPARVFTVGAPGLDALARTDFLPRTALEKELGIALAPPLALVTYHPETLSAQPPQEQIAQMLKALEPFQGTLIFTGANADAGGRAINRALETFAANRQNALFRLSFGSALYLSLMQEADVIMGNSSSGVIEAPVLAKATVNIGERQKGRLRAASVIDCACDAAAIGGALQKALSPEFRKSLKPALLFGTPGTIAPKIAAALCTLPIPKPVRKSFCDRR